MENSNQHHPAETLAAAMHKMSMVACDAIVNTQKSLGDLATKVSALSSEVCSLVGVTNDKIAALEARVSEMDRELVDHVDDDRFAALKKVCEPGGADGDSDDVGLRAAADALVAVLPEDGEDPKIREAVGRLYATIDLQEESVESDRKSLGAYSRALREVRGAYDRVRNEVLYVTRMDADPSRCRLERFGEALRTVGEAFAALDKEAK